MKVYHGTSLTRGLKILEDKKIKGENVDRVYIQEEIATTDGYVYLTNLIQAVYYGNKTSYFADQEDQLMVFELEVKDDLLEPDLDEIKYTLGSYGIEGSFKDIDNPTYQESWDNCKAVRIKGDIDLVPGEFRYAKISSTYFNPDYESAKQTLEYIQLREHDNEYANEFKSKFENEIDWKE